MALSFDISDLTGQKKSSSLPSYITDPSHFFSNAKFTPYGNGSQWAFDYNGNSGYFTPQTGVGDDARQYRSGSKYMADGLQAASLTPSVDFGGSYNTPSPFRPDGSMMIYADGSLNPSNSLPTGITGGWFSDTPWQEKFVEDKPLGGLLDNLKYAAPVLLPAGAVLGSVIGGLGAASSTAGATTGATTGAGGGMDMTGFMTNNSPFSYTPEFSWGNLSGFTPGEFTGSMLPGGGLSQYAGLGGVGGGMVDLGAAGAIAGVNLGGSEGLMSVLQKVAQSFGQDAAKSLASKIMNGDASAADMLAGFGRAIPGLIGAGASALLSNEAQDLARKYMEFGAPSRARFEASFAPGFSMANEPGYKDALDQTMKSFLHKASIGGNPADSPNAWKQTLTDVNSTFAFPALQNYRAVNAGAGGMASLAGSVPTFDMTSLKQTQNIADSLGVAASDVFNPPKSLADLLKQARVVY